MAGFPQLREAAWLYEPDDPTLPLALVRLFEHKDGSGVWCIHLNNPASAPPRTVDHPSEESARQELNRLYAEGGKAGRWRIRQPDGY